MNDAIIFRRRSEEYDARLAELWVASWQEAIPAIDFSARRSWLLDHLRALEAQGAVTICAFDAADALLGFVTCDPMTAYLDQLAVAPEAKGPPTARLLLNEARRCCPQNLVLDVNQDNLRAVRFYEREGFSKIAEGMNENSGLKTWKMAWRGS